MSDGKNQGPSFADVAKQARENAAEFAETVIGSPPTYRTSGSIRFFDNQSLIVHTRGNRQGTFSNFSDESARGDMLDLCTYIRGMSKHEALLYAKDVLGIEDTGLVNAGKIKIPQKSDAEKQREEEEIKRKKIRVANWIWSSSSPTEGKEEGEAYLNGRGLKGPFDPNLVRYRRLSPDDLKKMGAKDNQIPKTPVVAVVMKATNADGEITAVQQIITTEGKKISDVIPSFENAKRTNGHLTGSAVKFGGEKPEKVILAEGPETAVSLFEATQTPTWITLGTSNYTTLQMPTSVKELIVAADMEPSGTGLGSALRAAQHWEKMGVPKVGIALPRLQDGDHNDVLKQKGPEAVKSSVDNAFYGTKSRAKDSVVVTADARSAFHIWQKTGIETRVRVPGKNQTTGEHFPISLDSVVEEQHKQVLVVERPGFTIVDEHLKKARPDVSIQRLEESETFLKKARMPNYVEQSVSNLIDLHAPAGLGDKEPMAFCLRRKDADALHGAGHKAIAIRASGLETLDFSFMKGRRAFVCPLGKGTQEDEQLEEKLSKAGANTTRLAWQVFKPEGEGYKIVRQDVPDTYGAAEAVEEGWKGEKMAYLLKISTTKQEEDLKKIEQERKPKQTKSQDTR